MTVKRTFITSYIDNKEKSELVKMFLQGYGVEYVINNGHFCYGLIDCSRDHLKIAADLMDEYGVVLKVA